MTDTRPIWLTSDEIRHIAQMRMLTERHRFPVLTELAERIADAWDAAPADSTEAVLDALKGSLQYQHAGSSVGPKPKPEDFTAYHYPEPAAKAVLAALGRPSDD